MNGGEYFKANCRMPGLRTRALRGATVSAVAQGAVFGIQTISTIILARLLTPNDFGLVTMVLTFSLLLGNCGSNGFSEAVIQMKEINHNQISTLFWINVGLSVLLGMVFVAVAPLVVWFYKEPCLTSIVLAFAAGNIITGLSIQHLALLKRDMQFFATAVNEIAAVSISCGIPIFLALRGWGYWALVAKWIIAPVVTTCGAWILCSWRPGRPGKHTGVRPLLKFGFNTYGNFVMNYFRRNMDKMLIGRFWGSLPLGYYDRAYHFSNMGPNQIFNSLNNVAIASFSRLTDDPARYRRHFLQLVSLLAFLAMPLSAVLTLVSSDIVLIILGSKWTNSVEIFRAFAPSIGVSIIYFTHGWLHLSLGTTDRWFRWGILEIIVTAACYIVGLRFGALGVAIAFSASIYMLIVPALWYAGRPIGLKVSSFFGAVWKSFLVALVAGLISGYFLHVQGLTSGIFIHLSIWPRILVSAGLCISVYLLLIVAFLEGMQPISQLVSLLRDMVPARSSELT